MKNIAVILKILTNIISPPMSTLVTNVTRCSLLWSSRSPFAMCSLSLLYSASRVWRSLFNVAAALQHAGIHYMVADVGRNLAGTIGWNFLKGNLKITRTCIHIYHIYHIYHIHIISINLDESLLCSWIIWIVLLKIIDKRTNLGTLCKHRIDVFLEHFLRTSGLPKHAQAHMQDECKINAQTTVANMMVLDTCRGMYQI